MYQLVRNGSHTKEDYPTVKVYEHMLSLFVDDSVAEWFKALDLNSGGSWFKSSILPLTAWISSQYFRLQFLGQHPRQPPPHPATSYGSIIFVFICSAQI